MNQQKILGPVDPIGAFIDEFQQGDRSAMIRRIEPHPPSRNHRMSEWGHPCARFLWYRWHAWKDELPYDEGLARIFWIGESMESPIANRIQIALGPQWNILHVALAVILEREGMRRIVGHIDRIARLDGSFGRGCDFVLEIKTIEDSLLSRLNEWRDFLDMPQVWLRKYPAQIMGYTIGLMEEQKSLAEGLICLVGKRSGEIKMIRVPIDREIVDACFVRARFAESMTIDWLPEGGRIPFEPSVCGRCSFRLSCLPEMQGPKTDLASDPRMIDLLIQRRALLKMIDQDALKKLKEVEEEAKERARHAGHGNYITVDGRFGIEVKKPAVRTTYEVPDEIREPYKIQKEIASIVVFTDLEEPENGTQA